MTTLVVERTESRSGWQIEWRRGTAADLHDAVVADPASPSVWVCEPTGAALVLGSTQTPTERDRHRLASLGIDLVRRRSGGGAVLLLPQRCTWIDLVVPAGHHLWHDDVGRATHWVGELWAHGLARLAIEAFAHVGPMRPTAWSKQVCFAGLGPGEVVDPTGHKLVGVSQRRTRHAARFQTVAYHDTNLSEIVAVLGMAEPDATEVTDLLAQRARSLRCDHGLLVDAVLAALPPG